MEMRFEIDREVETGKRESAMLREQSEPRVKTAALCKAILNPKYFDNSKFWHLIYEKEKSDDFLKLADKMAFVNGVGRDEYFLGSSGDVDYFARWPHIEEVIGALKPHFSKEETFQLIFDCHYSPYQHVASRRHLNRKIDEVYEPEFAFCKPLGVESFTDSKLLGLHRTFHTPSASIWLKVLSGFMAALGSAALLLALTSFTFPAAPVAAIAGVALLAGSYGLFKHADKMPLVMEEHDRPTFQLG